MAKATWADYYASIARQARVNSSMRGGVSGPAPPNPYLNYGPNAGQAARGTSTGTNPSTGKKSKGFLESLLPDVDVLKDPNAGFMQKLIEILPPTAPIPALMQSAQEGEGSPGAIAFDLMSRGTYAGNSALKAYYDQDKGDQWHAPDIGEMLYQFGQGVIGRNKSTYADVAEAKGEEAPTSALGKTAVGIRNFLGDVVFDPTSYVGAGLIGKAGGLAGKASKVGRAATEAAPALDEAATAATTSMRTNAGVRTPEELEALIAANPDRPRGPLTPDEQFTMHGPSLKEFLEQVGRTDEPPLAVQQARANPVQGTGPLPPKGNVPTDPRFFGGDLGEVRQIGGPSPEVLAARAAFNQADELGRGVAQFNYGTNVMENLPQNGFFVDEVKRIPIEPDEAAPVIPLPQMKGVIPHGTNAATEKAELQAKFAHLAENGDKDLDSITDPIERIIMTRVDEPVYPRYTAKQVTVSDGKGGQKTNTVWWPDKRDVEAGNAMTIGRAREILMDPNVGTKTHLRVKAAIAEHIKAVKSYVESKPIGYESDKIKENAHFTEGVDNYFREMYGIKPSNMKKAMDAGKRAKAKADAPVLKADTPFKEVVPTHREIIEIQKMDPAGKRAVLQSLEEELGLTAEHVAYLGHARTHSAYIKRLQTVVDSWRTSEGIQDVADGIRAGRIRDLEEEGIPALLELFKVKTLPALANAIDRAAEKVTKAEQRQLAKMFPNANTKAGKAKALDEALAASGERTRQSPVDVPVGENVKELKPTGEEFDYHVGTAKVTPQGRRTSRMAKEAMEGANKRIPQTEEILERAQTDRGIFVEGSAVLDEAQQGMVARALDYALKETVVKGKNMQYTTKTGVKKSSPILNQGEAIRQGVWNNQSQRNLFSRVMKDFGEQMGKAKEAGILDETASTPWGRARIAYDRVMPVLQNIDQQLRLNGVFPVAGLYDSTSKVSMFDIMDTIDSSWIRKNIFTTKKRPTVAGSPHESLLVPTQLMEAVDTGIAAINKKNPIQADYDSARELIKSGLREKLESTGGNRVPNHVAETIPEDQMDAFIQPIMDALPELAAKSNKYTAAAKKYHDNKVVKGTQKSLEKLADLTLHPKSTNTSKMALSNDLESAIYKPVVKQEQLVPDDAQAMVNNVEGVVDEMGYTPEFRGQAKDAEVNHKATNTGKRDKDIDRSRASLAKVEDADEAVKLGDVGTKMETGVIAEAIQGFSTWWGNPHFRDLYTRWVNPTKAHTQMVAKALNRMHHQYGQAEIQNAYKKLQLGDWYDETLDPKLFAAQKDVHSLINQFFSENPGYSLFERENLNAEFMNEHFKHFGIGDKFRFDPKMPIHDQWKNWDTDDFPLLMNKMAAAANAALLKRKVGNAIMANPEWASKTPKEGYVRLRTGKTARSGNIYDSRVSNPGGKILGYIDQEMYYQKDIAREMAIFDKFLHTLDYNPKPLIKLYDEVLRMWKASVTYYRVGHHLRNLHGDIFFNFMAGVVSPKHYAKAIDLMASMPKGYGAEIVDIGKSIRGEAVDAVGPKAKKFNEDHFLTAKINGKEVSLTRNDIMRAANENGIITSYEIIEDATVHAGAEGGFMKALEHSGAVGNRIANPLWGKGKKAATAVSEGREHGARLAQFHYELTKKSYRSLDEAYAVASRRVRKWHPDGSDLTAFEQRAMRRVIPFYSWIRKAIPLVLESMVTQPGKVMMYPKAMYDMAEAHGIDLHSLSDPFPEDGLYPEWIKDGMQGPLIDIGGSEWGINPGNPAVDVISDYGNDPFKTMMGSAALPMKLIMEQINKNPGAVAQDVRTGIPYYDKSDYLDKQLPSSSYFTGLTGRSMSQPWQAAGGADKDPSEKQATLKTLINWITGIGATELNKPSYEKAAKREQGAKRNEERRR